MTKPEHLQLVFGNNQAFLVPLPPRRERLFGRPTEGMSLRSELPGVDSDPLGNGGANVGPERA